MTSPTIVVGVDGSENGQTALDWSISEALRRKAHLTLVHVVPPSSQASTLGFSPEPPDDQRRLLDRAVQHAEGRGIQVMGNLLWGNPADLLLDESKHADLLVVGSRGRGALRRATLGSVSTQCIHRAHCPVVVVPDSYRPNQGTRRSAESDGEGGRMLNEERFTIGTDVVCRDGPCGELRRIVIDPAARILTHLAVNPERGHDVGRLVPIGLVESSDGEIRLACSREEFDRLDPAEETQFLPGHPDYLDYNVDEIVAWPYFNWSGGMNMRAPSRGLPIAGPEFTTYESIPLGEVDIRRGERVEASDGEIGRVEGLVINPATHGVTHLLLQEGHLWGRKEVAIPITVVDAIDGGIGVRLTKQEVADLPPVDLESVGE